MHLAFSLLHFALLRVKARAKAGKGVVFFLLVVEGRRISSSGAPAFLLLFLGIWKRRKDMTAFRLEESRCRKEGGNALSLVERNGSLRIEGDKRDGKGGLKNNSWTRSGE
ncbi:hypothetical protein TWF281_005825 [Arthrobotrys megalospora]